MVVVSRWLVGLLGITRALTAPLVFALLADLDAGWELGLAVMAGTTDTHADWLADQVLSSSAGWDGENVLVLVLLLVVTLVAVAWAVLVLWLLCSVVC